MCTVQECEEERGRSEERDPGLALDENATATLAISREIATAVDGCRSACLLGHLLQQPAEVSGPVMRPGGRCLYGLFSAA